MAGSGKRSDSDAEADAGEPPLIGVVAALTLEIAPLLDRLRKTRRVTGHRASVVEGELREDWGVARVALAIPGPGRGNARRGTRFLIEGHRPRWVVSAGLAGGLNPSLERFAVRAVSETMDEEGRRARLAPEESPAWKLGLPGCRVETARLLTVDRIVRTTAERAALRERCGADLVDMETSAVAEICAERGVPLYGVRVVSDTADEELPAEVAAILGESGAFRLGAALGAIARRPSSLKELWGLRERAVEGSDRLFAHLTRWIAGFAELQRGARSQAGAVTDPASGSTSAAR